MCGGSAIWTASRKVLHLQQRVEVGAGFGQCFTAFLLVIFADSVQAHEPIGRTGGPRLRDIRPAHNCFGFHPNFTCNLIGVALLEFWQEEFHGERAGISFFRKLAQNSSQRADSIAWNNSR